MTRASGKRGRMRGAQWPYGVDHERDHGCSTHRPSIWSCSQQEAEDALWHDNQPIEALRAFSTLVFGLALLLAPLWTLSGFVTAPEYRTGTITDYRAALVSGLTLYSGVVLGVLISQRFKTRGAPAFRRVFIAGVAGAMAAITLVLITSFVSEPAYTGRMMPAGQTPALLPVLYIVGGILSAVIAAGAALIIYALERPRR